MSGAARQARFRARIKAELVPIQIEVHGNRLAAVLIDGRLVGESESEDRRVIARGVEAIIRVLVAAGERMAAGRHDPLSDAASRVLAAACDQRNGVTGAPPRRR